MYNLESVKVIVNLRIRTLLKTSTVTDSPDKYVEISLT